MLPPDLPALSVPHLESGEHRSLVVFQPLPDPFLLSFASWLLLLEGPLLNPTWSSESRLVIRRATSWDEVRVKEKCLQGMNIWGVGNRVPGEKVKKSGQISRQTTMESSLLERPSLSVFIPELFPGMLKVKNLPRRNKKAREIKREREREQLRSRTIQLAFKKYSLFYLSRYLRLGWWDSKSWYC